ncbi:MAG: hypothetical protein NTV05_01070 [Acidobacteria bacterium]|nr:hypothetical protein [Acidobacteriota bacterium]
MNKPTVVEIPTNATDQVVRLTLEQVLKHIKDAHGPRKEAVRVTIEQRR